MTITHTREFERKHKRWHKEWTNPHPRFGVRGCPCWAKVGNGRVTGGRRIVWVGLGENLGD